MPQSRSSPRSSSSSSHSKLTASLLEEARLPTMAKDELFRMATKGSVEQQPQAATTTTSSGSRSVTDKSSTTTATSAPSSSCSSNNNKKKNACATCTTAAARSTSCPQEEQEARSVRPQPQALTLEEQLHEALRDEQWDQVESLCELHPSLARHNFSMVCQGENSTCLPIHFAACLKSTPVSTIDALVTAHPGSLVEVETSGSRTPLHLAILKGASYAVVRYLCEALSQSMGITDQEGNLPLHYAAMYSNDAIVNLMIKSYPQACSKANERSDRYPLHLLCARSWDEGSTIVSLETIESVVHHYPQALQAVDRRGRLPLHICCSSQPGPRGDVLQLLMDRFPEGLLETDQSKSIPVDLAKKFGTASGGSGHTSSSSSLMGSVDPVLLSLQDATNRERRKKYKFFAPFKVVGNKLARRRHSRSDVDALHLHYCYG